MPRKSSRSLSQPTRTSNNRVSTSSSQAASTSTQHSSQSTSAAAASNLDDYINDLVRYILFRAGRQQFYRKTELQKNVLPNAARSFEDIMVQATATLRHVYGYNVVVCDATTNTTKGYIVSNALPFVAVDDNNDDEDESLGDNRKILLMLVLAHIFMSDAPVSEASLYSFLKLLKVDVEKKHVLFGDCKDYIGNVMVKEKYLSADTDAITRKSLFSWGVRAEAEISKHEILKFICKIHGNSCLPTAWEKQYKVANEQHFENHKIGMIDPNESMDVE